MIYELLTGELPLGRFAPPSEKVSVDVRLDEIVLHTLAKEPSLRYQRVSEVGSDMQALSAAQAKAGDHNHEAMVAAQKARANVHSNARPAPPVKSYAPSPELPGPFPNSNFFGTIREPQTYRNIFYLLLSFPLGLIYFVFLVVFLSLGLGTLIIWIGAFILLMTFMAVRGFTAMERHLTVSMLRTSIPDRRPRYSPAPPTHQSTFDRAKRLVFSRESWAGIVYLMVKFPLGVVSFVLTVALLPVSIALMFSANHADDSSSGSEYFLLGNRHSDRNGSVCLPRIDAVLFGRPHPQRHGLAARSMGAALFETPTGELKNGLGFQ